MPPPPIQSVNDGLPSQQPQSPYQINPYNTGPIGKQQVQPQVGGQPFNWLWGNQSPWGTPWQSQQFTGPQHPSPGPPGGPHPNTFVSSLGGINSGTLGGQPPPPIFGSGNPGSILQYLDPYAGTPPAPFSGPQPTAPTPTGVPWTGPAGGPRPTGLPPFNPALYGPPPVGSQAWLMQQKFGGGPPQQGL